MAEPLTLVVDSSPLILAARAEVLHLLRAAGDRIVVPRAVVHEVKAKSGDPAADALDALSWLEVVDAPTASSPLSRWGLGAGEDSVLTWAEQHPGSRAVLDDDRARRAARELGVPVIGTLGLVLAAKEAGRLVEARPLVERLVEAGMYLSPRLLAQALALLGE